MVLARPGCDTCAHPTSATTAPLVAAPRRKLVRVELRERMGQPVDDFDELLACLHVSLRELACQPIAPTHGNPSCRPVGQPGMEDALSTLGCGVVVGWRSDPSVTHEGIANGGASVLRRLFHLCSCRPRFHWFLCADFTISSWCTAAFSFTTNRPAPERHFGFDGPPGEPP